MVIDTRSAPDFPYDSQKELYNIRREFALMVKLPYDPEYEQTYIGTMTAERTSEVLAKTTGERNVYKRTSKKSKGKVTTSTATKPADGTEASAAQDPTNTGKKGVSANAPANELATDEDPEQNENENETDADSVNETEPSDPSSSSSSDDDDDPRLRTSKKDKRTVRGRTPSINVNGKTFKELFKMDPPPKYSGEKDNDRTYDTVHQFLSQLSRYLRLAMNIDMDDDIVDYVLGFLDGFAYRWFEASDEDPVQEASNENPAHENETDRESRSETEVSFAPRSSSSSNEDDDKDGDPRRRTSKKDGQDVRGRTPRIDTSKTSEKLFKTDPPRSTPTREN